MENPKISVIVPVYNAEKYLHRCVDSILNQSFGDIEVLLVNDGSIDGSGMICDDYALKDSRVRVFHKENGGVSSARNVGLKNMIGEYSIHVDSDDWIELNMYEEMYSLAQAYNSDIVICDYAIYHGHEVSHVRQKPEKMDSMEMINSILKGEMHGSTWNKLIRNSIIKDKLFFDERISYCEDTLFIIQALLKSKRNSYIDKVMYAYCQNSESITNAPSIKNILGLVLYLEQLEKILHDSCFNEGFNIQVICVKLIMAKSGYFSSCFLRTFRMLSNHFLFKTNFEIVTHIYMKLYFIRLGFISNVLNKINNYIK